MNVDPLRDDYPWYTPYQYAGNKPINFIDLDGKEEFEPSIPVEALIHAGTTKGVSEAAAKGNEAAAKVASGELGFQLAGAGGKINLGPLELGANIKVASVNMKTNFVESTKIELTAFTASTKATIKNKEKEAKSC